MADQTTSGPAAPTPSRPAPVAGVLLAAGRSSRMGSNKLLLEVGGEPLVRRAARVALEAGLDPVVVVTGHQAALVEAALRGLPCRAVRAPDPAQGQGASLAAGLAALPPGAEAAVVLLADMPRVTAAMVSALVARATGSEAPLVLSDYGGVLAPPALYRRALFQELSDPGETPGRRVLARHRAEALTVAFPAEALADVDVPADLAGLATLPGGRP
ncbi:MAG: nucleotidyltransferase family protein [Anaeromyxobacter sp.]|nr:nucleotidyltransferase family protein [Anaeromyxobacter sp.]MBL0277748.1 nucleotidyltransferase family protein [Anaeromyxobacter sp.]